MSDVPMSVERVVGRKAHQCIWCRGGVPIGERHVHGHGKFGGDWQNWRMHEDCYEFAQDATPFDECYCDGRHERASGCADCLPEPRP